MLPVAGSVQVKDWEVYRGRELDWLVQCQYNVTGCSRCRVLCLWHDSPLATGLVLPQTSKVQMCVWTHIPNDSYFSYIDAWMIAKYHIWNNHTVHNVHTYDEHSNSAFLPFFWSAISRYELPVVVRTVLILRALVFMTVSNWAVTTCMYTYVVPRSVSLHIWRYGII